MNGIISFFTWCVKHKYISESPCQGIRFTKASGQKSEKPRSPFSPDELNVLFNQPEFKDPQKIGIHPERFWVPLIAVYSGMRLNEICQLHVKDIKKIDGVLVFDISDNEPDKSIKTASSRRIIPVHPQLIALGLEDYLNKIQTEWHQRLFPTFRKGIDGYGHSIRNWFMLVMKQLRMKKCFHELRHTFAHLLKQAGVDEISIAELLGHSNNSITSRYAHGLTVIRKLEIIARVELPLPPG